MDNKATDEKSVPATEGINGEGEVIEMGEIFSKYGSTKRGLSNRHIQLISIAGSIGTALFVAIGSHMHAAGPLNFLLAFMIYPVVFVLPCYLCVAEMACHLPIKGTIYEMATRFGIYLFLDILPIFFRIRTREHAASL
jgi:amino acid transporter